MIKITIKKRLKKRCSESGHTTKEQGCPLDSPPHSFHVEKKDIKLLRYVFDNRDSRLNIRAYSRLTDIPRPTVYHILDRLILKGLVDKPHAGNHKITEQGIYYINVTGGGVHNVRRGCPDNASLSMHYTKYYMDIKEKSNFHESKIKNLNPISWKKVSLINLESYYLYFADATIIINPKKIIIRIHDITSEDTEEAHFKTFKRAMGYASRINLLNIEADNIRLQEAHYARVESLLSEFLEKVDKRYFLDLGEGKKFWIDNSGDKLEDETKDPITRERVDEFMVDMINSKSLMSDVDKQKEVMGMLLKLKMLKAVENLQPPSPKNNIIKKRDGKSDYFG